LNKSPWIVLSFVEKFGSEWVANIACYAYSKALVSNANDISCERWRACLC